MSERPTAESVVAWQMATCWFTHKDPETEVELNSLLGQGFEPFAVVSSGQAGSVIYLKRQVHNDG